VLLDPGTGEFFPAWYLDRTKGFQTLGEAERHRLRGLLDQRRKESEDIWEARGRRILAMLKNATDMLVCAEDLGDVPNCVPRSLADLGILGLRIVRWSREYAKSVPGLPPPFIAPVAYPRLSVCTPSVHDTSTLRAWWEEDASERGEFLRSMGGSGACPPRMSVELLERAIAHCLDARSLLCMFQIQDLLDLDETLQAPDPKTDRINVPGTVSDFNWTWRMPLRIEELMERRSLTQRLRRMIEPRRQTPLEGS
jgi:4-alpha-glucanotransferase